MCQMIGEKRVFMMIKLLKQQASFCPGVVYRGANVAKAFLKFKSHHESVYRSNIWESFVCGYSVVIYFDETSGHVNVQTFRRLNVWTFTCPDV